MGSAFAGFNNANANFFIGMLMLVLGGATLLTCFDISNKMQQFMLKSYVKLRFGSEYYSVWMFTQRRKWFEHYQNEKTEKEKELEPLKKAELEHFEEWKKYHKSSLTFSEWKQKYSMQKCRLRGNKMLNAMKRYLNQPGLWWTSLFMSLSMAMLLLDRNMSGGSDN